MLVCWDVALSLCPVTLDTGDFYWSPVRLCQTLDQRRVPLRAAVLVEVAGDSLLHPGLDKVRRRPVGEAVCMLSLCVYLIVSVSVVCVVGARLCIVYTCMHDVPLTQIHRPVLVGKATELLPYTYRVIPLQP